MSGSDGGTMVGGEITRVIGAGTTVLDDVWRSVLARCSIGFGAGVALNTTNSGLTAVRGAAVPCIVAAVVTPMIATCAAMLSAAPPVRRCRRARDSSSVPNMSPSEFVVSSD
jgi:hypothetical protein